MIRATKQINGVRVTLEFEGDNPTFTEDVAEALSEAVYEASKLVPYWDHEKKEPAVINAFLMGATIPRIGALVKKDVPEAGTIGRYCEIISDGAKNMARRLEGSKEEKHGLH